MITSELLTYIISLNLRLEIYKSDVYNNLTVKVSNENGLSYEQCVPLDRHLDRIDSFIKHCIGMLSLKDLEKDLENGLKAYEK